MVKKRQYTNKVYSCIVSFPYFINKFKYFGFNSAHIVFTLSLAFQYQRIVCSVEEFAILKRACSLLLASAEDTA